MQNGPNPCKDGLTSLRDKSPKPVYPATATTSSGDTGQFYIYIMA